MKRLVVLSALLLLPLLGVSPTSAAPPAPTAAAVSTAAAAPAARASRYPTRFKCDSQGNICVRLTGRKKTLFAPVYSSGVQNRTGDRITGHCTSTEQRTKSWTLGMSLSAELKAGIFAKINATISGSVTKSITTTTSVSADFPVRPHSTRGCDYGIAIFRWKAQRFDRIRGAVSNFTVTAPRRSLWRIDDIN